MYKRQDDDGQNDIQVGLQIAFDLGSEFGIEGDTLWVKPTISFTVVVLESSEGDAVWDELQNLQVSLLKAFAYSEGILTGGESMFGLLTHPLQLHQLIFLWMLV